MKAAYITEYGEPSVVQIGELDEPPLGPDVVLVEATAASVNPVDWKILTGKLSGAIPHHLPLIPGWDVAGVVAAVGPAVTSVRPGDRVLAYNRQDHVQFGTYAERVAVPERAIAKTPDTVSDQEAGALPLAGLTAEQMLDAGNVGEGDTVLVHAAAGGVGGFASQLARIRGARVIGTASPGNHDFLRDRGIEPVSYGDPLVDEVRTLAPNGVDVVLDLVGGADFAKTDELSAEGRRVVSIVGGQEILESLGGQYVFVRGNGAQLAKLAQLVAEQRLRVEVAQTYPLERTAEALQANKDGHTRGKIVIAIR